MEEKGVWRTIRGRRVFIREGEDLASAMKRSGKFKGTTKQGEVPTKSTLNTMTEKNSDIAEKIIADDEWNDVKVTRYGNGNAVIENERTGQKVKITPSDTKESLSRKIEDSYKEYVNKNLNSDEYLKANRPNEYFQKQLRESGVKTFADEIKEGNPIENMANKRIKEKSNTLNNDKIMLDYMKKKNIEEIQGMTQKDFENRINKNEKYLKTAGNITKTPDNWREQLKKEKGPVYDKVKKYIDNNTPQKEYENPRKDGYSEIYNRQSMIEAQNKIHKQFKNEGLLDEDEYYSRIGKEYAKIENRAYDDIDIRQQRRAIIKELKENNSYNKFVKKLEEAENGPWKSANYLDKEYIFYKNEYDRDKKFRDEVMKMEQVRKDISQGKIEPVEKLKIANANEGITKENGNGVKGKFEGAGDYYVNNGGYYSVSDENNFNRLLNEHPEIKKIEKQKVYTHGDFGQKTGEYYKKEKLGAPSNYQKGDKIEFDNGYYETIKGSVVREATEKEKRYNINPNLKGYIVRDTNGNEHIVADTRIKKHKNDDISPMSEYSDTTGTGLSDKQHTTLSKMSLSELRKTAQEYNINTTGLSKQQLLATLINIFNK